LHEDNPTHQGRLLIIAGVFLGVYALALTIAPAARARSWDVDYRWEHWAGYLVWLVGFWVVQRQSERYLSQKDPYILPVVALISGWGLLTIWRLTPTFGFRQTVWLGICLGVLTIGLRLPSDLGFLRRYKYIWLTSGLVLTTLTLIYGTNPMGFGPRLWLGCCGIYLQPSEPLKLLLIIYLAAYFADWSRLLTFQHDEARSSNHRPIDQSTTSRVLTPHLTPKIPKLQILVPTLIMTGIATLLLLVQRDLGTATIFIFLYSAMVFLATGWRWVPAASLGTLFGAGVLGYLVYDVIRLRVDAWINPWLDPTGRSYQIVQSLLAVANGVIFGRGPGLGNPSLVPVAHSDFIFVAIAEEGGLVSTIGLFMLLGFLIYRGLRTATLASDNFRRYLASGLTAFLAAQSVLIMGGNLRLLPLTGVTLPFVSYGGSSLLISYLTITILLHISADPSIRVKIPGRSVTTQPTAPFKASITHLSSFLFTGLAAASLITGWWAIVRGPDLLTRTDNPRRAIADRYVQRGSLLDRLGMPIAETTGQTGDYVRSMHYPDLGSVIGYSHPVYGQSGLEASLDPILRGEEGTDPITKWWNQLLYGQPPPGLDVRLTLDLELQRTADELLTGQVGGLLLLNAENGEILVMASHPTYDPNQLEAQWDDLVQDPQSPLLNRVIQGIYPTGDLADLSFVRAAAQKETDPISLRLPLAATNSPDETSLIEMALAAAALGNNGTRPAPAIAQLVENPDGGWLLLSTLNSPDEIFPPDETTQFTQDLAESGAQTWQIIHSPEGEHLTWYVGGTTPDWDGLSLVLVIVLENKDPIEDQTFVKDVGQTVLSAAMGP